MNDAEILALFFAFCKKLTHFPVDPLQNTSTLKLLHPLFIAVLTRLSYKHPTHGPLLKALGPDIVAVLDPIVRFCTNVLYGYDGKTKPNRPVLPSHYYLLDIFAFVSDQILRDGVNTECKGNPFTFFQIPDTAVETLLKVAFFLYTSIRGNVFPCNLLSIKTNPRKSLKVHDYLGEFQYPILYDLLLFLGQVCLVQLKTDTVVRTLLTTCSYFDPFDRPIVSGFVYTTVFDYINFLASFKRFAWAQPVLDHPYTAYFLQNAELYDKIVESIPEVVEFAQKSIGDPALLSNHTQPTVVNLKASVAAPVLSQKLSGKAFGKNSAKKSLVFDDEVIKKLTHKEAEPTGKQTTLHPKYTAWRVKIDPEEMATKPTEQFMGELFTLREEQSTMVDKSVIQAFFWTRPMSYSRTLSYDLGFDFFFPHVNASCVDMFRTRFFERRLIEPVLSGNCTCFFTFADAPMFSTALVPPLQKALAQLLNFPMLEKDFLKNPAVFAPRRFYNPQDRSG